MAQGALFQASVSSDASKLPRLRPHANKKAQEIIAAHMRSGSSVNSVFSAATVHVLSKIDNTSTQKSRSHDISHLLDGVPALAPRIPPSLMPEEDHVYEKRFLPEEVGSTYNAQDGMWYVKVFPSDKPSSRTDAVMLDAWITRSLEHFSGAGGRDDKEDLATTVESLVPILSVGLHELVRQVTHHCAERGLALEKIWRAYVELFDRVLRQMRGSLQEQRRKTAETQRALQEVKAQLREVKRRHPQDMQNAIKDIETNFSQRQQDQEQELKQAIDENSVLQQELRAHRKELEIWFPGFSFYQDSYIKNALPQRMIGLTQQRGSVNSTGDASLPVSRVVSEAFHGRVEEGEATAEAAEVAFAEDLKRLLAVLSAEKRRVISQELAFIMEANDAVSPSGRTGRKHGHQGRAPAERSQAAAGGDEKAKLEKETLELLRADIRLQEERIMELREEIARVETGHVDEVEELLAVAAARSTRKSDDSDLNLGEELGKFLWDGKADPTSDKGSSGNASEKD